jgi:hypothetical protein
LVFSVWFVFLLSRRFSVSRQSRVPRLTEMLIFTLRRRDSFGHSALTHPPTRLL